MATLYPGTVRYPAKYDPDGMYGPRWFMNITVHDPSAPKLRDDGTVYVNFKPHDQELGYAQSLSQGDPCQISYITKGQNGFYVIQVPAMAGMAEGSAAVLPPQTRQAPVTQPPPATRQLTPTGAPASGQTYEKYSDDDMIVWKTLLDDQLRVLSVAFDGAKSAFPDLSPDITEKFAVTAYINASRSFKRGISVIGDDSVLFETMVRSNAKGIVQGVLQSIPMFVPSVNDGNHAATILREFGMDGNSISQEDPDTWVFMLDVVSMYAEKIREGVPSSDAVAQVAEAKGIIMMDDDITF